jgi:hypothetical protein
VERDLELKYDEEMQKRVTANFKEWEEDYRQTRMDRLKDEA